MKPRLPRWRARTVTLALDSLPERATVALDSWPDSTLRIEHEHHHTYAKRPKPDPPASFETWIEVDGCPVSGRVVFQGWGTSKSMIDIPSHMMSQLIDRATARQYTQVTVCVQPRY